MPTRINYQRVMFGEDAFVAARDLSIKFGRVEIPVDICGPISAVVLQTVTGSLAALVLRYSLSTN